MGENNYLSIIQGLDIESILDSIEAHNGFIVKRASGVHSFSHLTFHEYFTACQIKEKSSGDFKKLIQHVNGDNWRRWREVMLFISEMVDNPDQLLQDMKYELDNIITQDKKICDYFIWHDQEKLIKKYYEISYLLLECLHNCQDSKTSKEIKSNLLLPASL